MSKHINKKTLLNNVPARCILSLSKGNNDFCKVVIQINQILEGFLYEKHIYIRI